MQKISDSTNTANAAGEFTEGNPAAGAAATLLKAAWLNAIQRELAALATSSGIALNPTDDTQVLKAVKSLISKLALQIGSVSRQLPALSAPQPGGTDGSGGGGALVIREAQEVEGTKTDLAYAPRIVFTWKGLFARDMAMSTTGDLLWGGAKTWTAANFNPDLKANATDVTSALAAKANKSTTLGGYGIDDAFTKTQTTAAIQAAIAALVGTAPGALDQLDELARAMGNDPNFATTMLNALAQKADKATTLGGYGIVVPTQPQAEAGVDNSLPMTPLRVLQAFNKYLVQSTETAFGAARVSNQAQANAGLDDSTMMTPIKVAKAAPSVRGTSGNLRLSTTGTTAVVSITADQLTLQGPSGAASSIKLVNLAASTAMTGAGGLDAGVIAANTLYSVWVIYNPINGDLAGLLSSGSTPPTLPWSGDVRYARVGWIKTDASAGRFPIAMTQGGGVVQLKSPLLLASGVQGAAQNPASYVSVSVLNIVPPTAFAICCTAHNLNGGVGVVVAPNPSYGGFDSTTNLPPIAISAPANISLNLNATARILLESTNIYYASGSSTGSLVVTGWEDSL